MTQSPPAARPARRRPGGKPRCLNRYKQYDGPAMARAIAELDSVAHGAIAEVARRFGVSDQLVRRIHHGQRRRDLQPLIRAHRRRLNAELLAAARRVAVKRLARLQRQSCTGSPPTMRRAREALMRALIPSDLSGELA